MIKDIKQNPLKYLYLFTAWLIICIILHSCLHPEPDTRYAPKYDNRQERGLKFG